MFYYAAFMGTAVLILLFFRARDQGSGAIRWLLFWTLLMAV